MAVLKKGDYLIRSRGSDLLWRVVGIQQPVLGVYAVEVIRVKPSRNSRGVWEVVSFGRTRYMAMSRDRYAPHGTKGITEREILQRGY